MGIHYITAIDAPENIQRSLDEHLKDSVYRVAEGQWFVDFEGTSKQLSDQIGITDGNLGGAVVMSVSNYFGYAHRHVGVAEHQVVEAPWRHSVNLARTARPGTRLQRPTANHKPCTVSLTTASPSRPSWSCRSRMGS